MSSVQPPTFGPLVQLDPSARIGLGCVLDGAVTVGAGVQMEAGVLVQGPCVLSAGVRLAAGVRVVGLVGHDPLQGNMPGGKPAATAGLHIGPGACVEAGALLTGAIGVGAGAVVRPGAVVTQSYIEDSLQQRVCLLRFAVKNLLCSNVVEVLEQWQI